MTNPANSPPIAHPIAAVLDPVAVAQVMAIPLDLIDASDRLREVDEAHAQVMASSFAERGQRTPVEVVRRDDRYRLVYGAHRFRAAQIAQLNAINAIVVEATDAEARLSEIDENLIRNELSALDRARFLAERKRIYEALHPETKNGSNQHSRGFANLANPSFGDDIAERTGLSYRTIARAVALAEALSPEVVKAVRHTSLARNQAALETLAKHPHERQVAAVGHLLAEENPAKSVNEAFDRIDGKAVKPVAELKVAKFIDMWGRMSARERHQAMEALGLMEAVK